MKWLDLQLILEIFTTSRRPALYLSDIFETPDAYRKWLLPWRYLLARRYLQTKEALLARYDLLEKLPLSTAQYEADLFAQLGGPLFQKYAFWGQAALMVGGRKLAVSKLPPRFVFLRTLFIRPLFALFLAGTFWLLTGTLSDRNLDTVFSDKLVEYCDGYHQLQSLDLLQKELGNFVEKPAELKAASQELAARLTSMRHEILAAVEGDAALYKGMKDYLAAIADHAPPLEIVKLGKKLNSQLEKSGIGYYVENKSYTYACLSFLPLSLDERLDLAKNLPAEAPLFQACNTTMVVPYRVAERKYFNNRRQKYQVQYLYRVDRLPITEGALGLTVRGSYGAQVFEGRIRAYLLEEVLPLLEKDGSSILSKLGGRAYPLLDEYLARIYENWLLEILGSHQKLDELLAQYAAYKNYLKEADIIGQRQLLGQGHRLGGLDAEVLEPLDLSLLDPVTALLERGTAFHEVTHLINSREVLYPLLPAYAAMVPERYRQVASDEVSAYLSGMYLEPASIPLLAPHLAAFGLNQQDNGTLAEHYVARLIWGHIFSALRLGSPAETEVILADDEEIIQVLPHFMALSRGQQQDLLAACHRVLFGENIRWIKMEN